MLRFRFNHSLEFESYLANHVGRVRRRWTLHVMGVHEPGSLGVCRIQPLLPAPRLAPQGLMEQLLPEGLLRSSGCGSGGGILGVTVREVDTRGLWLGGRWYLHLGQKLRPDILFSPVGWELKEYGMKIGYIKIFPWCVDPGWVLRLLGCNCLV